MIVIWSELAVESFQQIRDYIYSQFGIVAENKYLEAVDNAVSNIVQFPKSGQIVECLSDELEVRSFIFNRRSKFIYYISEDTIHIADVWDVRQDPELLISRTTI